MTLRLAIIFVTAASVIPLMTLINKIHEIVIQCKWTTRVYFLAFLANVNCRISTAYGGFAPWTPIRALLWNRWGLKAPPDPQLQGTMIAGHCMSYFRHNIHTSCNLQNDRLREKHINFNEKTQGKMGGSHQKLRENSGKMMLKILYGSC